MADDSYSAGLISPLHQQENSIEINDFHCRNYGMEE